MHRPRTWAVVGAVAAITGIAVGATAVAKDDIELHDSPAVEQVAVQGPAAAGNFDWTSDSTAESADSPAESAFDSVDSAVDSPDDPGYVDPSPESADSPGESPFDSVDSAVDSPDDPGYLAPQPAPAPVADSGGSADSPYVAPKPAKKKSYGSANSGNSGNSGGSADSG